MGVLAGAVVTAAECAERGGIAWWLIPLWVIFGIYSGGAVALAGGALGNLLGGLYKASRTPH